jgi:glycosyltransferase involved in cell wall biosynthesis
MPLQSGQWNKKGNKKMVDKLPKVSLGLPVYNGEKYLTHALIRLLEQDYEDFELIISDNSSTDGTSDICKEYARIDRRIRYFRNNQNIGLAANHNRTFQLARGQFFKWVAHDDDFPQTMLRRFVRALEEASPHVCLVYSFCEYVDEDGKIEHIDSDRIALHSLWPHNRLAHVLRNIHMYNSIYGLIRSDVLRQTHLHGLFPGSDHVLLSELAMLGIFAEIREPLLRIRRHAGRSFTKHKELAELRELFNPGATESFSILGLWGHVNLELVRSALLIPKEIKDKILCTAVALSFPHYCNVRNYAGKQKRKVLQMLSS